MSFKYTISSNMRYASTDYAAKNHCDRVYSNYGDTLLRH